LKNRHNDQQTRRRRRKRRRYESCYKNRHLELEIMTLLQNAPIDAGKVGKAFESKRGKTKRRRLCTHRRYTKRLVV
jgi:hypothetical protein